MANGKFEVGSLVLIRERQWVVLPESTEEWLMVRPMAGTAEEVTGIYLPLEAVEPAHFVLPDPSLPGDYRSCRLMRDAMRLGFRASTGPFRSFARLSVEPRPYQLVPLLMALRMDPVRLLIADDVGVGKTIEAGVIARELLDRGETQRLAVICPPHLVDQWLAELKSKFHIDAQPVTAGSATRLERNCAMGQTLFDLYPHVVVSLDFIKTDRRRDDFKRTCPELVIIDEAHTCTFGAVGRGRQQRHQLVQGLSENPRRHMILLTATPHSGKENAFRSLMGLLNRDFESMPGQESQREHEAYLRRISTHLVQRRRVDIESYMDENTLFPVRDPKEETYSLTPDYKRLFEKVLNFARESVQDRSGGRHRERVRWWSALALLRALASSPAAAAATLRTRAAPTDTLTEEEADEIGQHTVMDIIQEEIADSSDITPGSQTEEDEDSSLRRRLLKMAREAELLKGKQDAKLQKGIAIIRNMLKEGFRPVVFCRFIHTADYLAEELKKKLGSGVEVSAVTGVLPPQEREIRVNQLAQSPKSVLVATDCLSEGINLQHHFDAVFHYDLSWNPTRHEQREGRVDRFGQEQETVRVVTLYGLDNQIDGIVLEVLIRKHNTIRESLKVSIPVPTDTSQLMEAIFEGLLLREHSGSAERYLPGFEEFFKPQRDQLHLEWERLSKEEEKAREWFTHASIKVDEVARELAAVRAAMGAGADVAAFFKNAMIAHGAVVNEKEGRYSELSLESVPETVKEALGIVGDRPLRVRFNAMMGDGVYYLHRTHPMVEGLARYVLDAALDRMSGPVARRCGVIRTAAVDTRTTLLLVRFRFHISGSGRGDGQPLLAEECCLMGFKGSPANAQWLDLPAAEELMNAVPSQNTGTDEATYFLERVIQGFDALAPHLQAAAWKRAGVLQADHLRVSESIGAKQRTVTVEPLLPPDVPGIYIYLPAQG
jgi:superfamily II DNA or RNA helicase